MARNKGPGLVFPEAQNSGTAQPVSGFNEAQEGIGLLFPEQQAVSGVANTGQDGGAVQIDSDGNEVSAQATNINFTGDVTVTGSGESVTVDVQAPTEITELPDGSASTPAIRFASDQDTGIYRSGDNDVGISAGGSNVLDVRNNAVVASQPVVLPLGSSSAPALRFTGDGTSGYWQNNDGDWILNVDGSVHTVFRDNELEVREDLMLTSGNNLIMGSTTFTESGGTGIADHDYVEGLIDNVRTSSIQWRDGDEHQSIVSFDSDGELVDIHVADSEYTPEIIIANYNVPSDNNSMDLVVDSANATFPITAGTTVIINTTDNDYELDTTTIPTAQAFNENTQTLWQFPLSDVTILRGTAPSVTQLNNIYNGQLKSIHNKSMVAELATKAYVDNSIPETWETELSDANLTQISSTTLSYVPQPLNSLTSSQYTRTDTDNQFVFEFTADSLTNAGSLVGAKVLRFRNGSTDTHLRIVKLLLDSAAKHNTLTGNTDQIWCMQTPLNGTESNVTGNPSASFWADANTAPTGTANNPTITFTQGGSTVGTITLNQTDAETVAFAAGTGDSRVAVDDGGDSSSVADVNNSNYGIAIGANAELNASGTGGGIAIGVRSDSGDSIQTGASRAIALGFNASISSGLDHSVAIGQESTAISSRQLMLGATDGDNGFTSVRVGNTNYVPSNDLDLAPKNYVDGAVFDDQDRFAAGGTGTASAGGTNGVAAGVSSSAGGTSSVALGESANAAASTSVALGMTATIDSSATNAIAIGHDADVDEVDGIGIGFDATVADGHTNSIALGKNSATTAANQMVIGSTTASESITAIRTPGFTGGTNQYIAVSSDGTWSTETVSSSESGIEVVREYNNDTDTDVETYSNLRVDTDRHVQLGNLTDLENIADSFESWQRTDDGELNFAVSGDVALADFIFTTRTDIRELFVVNDDFNAVIDIRAETFVRDSYDALEDRTFFQFPTFTTVATVLSGTWGTTSIETDANSTLYVNPLSNNTVDGRLNIVTVDSIDNDIQYMKVNSTGTAASAVSDDSIAIGENAATGSISGPSIAIGQNATANGFQGIAIGETASAGASDDSNTIAIGQNATAGGDNVIVIGSGATSDANDGIAIGMNADADATSSIAIGDNAGTSHTFDANRSIAIGRSAYTGGEDSIAIGDNADVADDQNDSIAIGHDADADDSNAIAIGRSASVGTAGEYSVVIGDNASSTENGSVVIGREASSTDQVAIAIGKFADADGVASIAIGASNDDGGSANATSTGDYGIAIGNNTEVAHNESIALGRSAETDTDNQFVLGSSTTITRVKTPGFTGGTDQYIAVSSDGTWSTATVSGGGDTVFVDDGLAALDFVSHNDSDVDFFAVATDTALAEDRVYILANEGANGDNWYGVYFRQADVNDTDLQSARYLSISDGTNTGYFRVLRSKLSTTDNTNKLVVVEIQTEPFQGTFDLTDYRRIVGTDDTVNTTTALSFKAAMDSPRSLFADQFVAGTGISLADVSQTNGSTRVRITATGDSAASLTDDNAGNGISISSNVISIDGDDAFDSRFVKVNNSATDTAASATGDNTIAIGTNATASDREAVAIGLNAIASDNNTVAIGGRDGDSAFTTASGAASIAIGFTASASGTGAIALRGQATSNGSVAIGSASTADTDFAIAIGRSTNAEGVGSIALGSGVGDDSADVTAGSDYAIAIGSNTLAMHDNAVAIGRNAETTAANQIMLGDTDSTNGFTDIRVGNPDYSPSNSKSIADKEYVDNATNASLWDSEDFAVISRDTSRNNFTVRTESNHTLDNGTDCTVASVTGGYEIVIRNEGLNMFEISSMRNLNVNRTGQVAFGYYEIQRIDIGASETTIRVKENQLGVSTNDVDTLADIAAFSANEDITIYGDFNDTTSASKFATLVIGGSYVGKSDSQYNGNDVHEYTVDGATYYRIILSNGEEIRAGIGASDDYLIASK